MLANFMTVIINEVQIYSDLAHGLMKDILASIRIKSNSTITFDKYEQSCL